MATQSLRIQIEGIASGLNNAVNQANASLNSLNANARNSSNALNQMNASTKKLGSALKTLGITAGAAFAAFRGIKTIGTIFANFGKSMAAVKAVSGATELQMRTLTKTARDLGASTMFSASQAADGMKFLSMAGFTVSETNEAIADTLNLAAAGMMELSRAADIASNIMTAFGMQASEVGHASDVLAVAASSSNTNIEQLGDAMKYAGAAASASGMSMLETTAAIGTLSNAGLQASMAGTGVRQVLVKLAEGGAGLRSVLTQVGLSMTDVSVSANGGLLPVMQKLAGANLTAEQAFEAFGARAGTAFLALSAGVGYMEELVESMSNGEGAAQEMADIMADSLAGDLMKLKSAFEELILGNEDLMQSFRDAVVFATDVIKVLSGVGIENKALEAKIRKGIAAVKALGVAFIAIKGLKFASVIANAAFNMKNLFLATRLTSVASMGAAGSQAALAGATGAVSVGATGAAVATRSFTAALLANPITAIAVAILAAGTAFVSFASSIGNSTDKARSDIKDLKNEMGDFTIDTSADEALQSLMASVNKDFAKRKKELKERQTGKEDKDAVKVALSTVDTEKGLDELTERAEKNAEKAKKAWSEIWDARVRGDATKEELDEATDLLAEYRAQLSIIRQHGKAFMNTNAGIKQLRKNQETLKKLEMDRATVAQKNLKVLEDEANVDIKVKLDVQRLKPELNDAMEDVTRGLNKAIEGDTLSGMNVDTEVGLAAQKAIISGDFDEIRAMFAEAENIDPFGANLAGIEIMPDFDSQVKSIAQGYLELLETNEEFTDETLANVQRMAQIKALRVMGIEFDSDAIDEFEEKMKRVALLKEVAASERTIKLLDGASDPLSKATTALEKHRSEIAQAKLDYDEATASLKDYEKALIIAKGGADNFGDSANFEDFGDIDLGKITKGVDLAKDFRASLGAKVGKMSQDGEIRDALAEDMLGRKVGGGQIVKGEDGLETTEMGGGGADAFKNVFAQNLQDKLGLVAEQRTAEQADAFASMTEAAVMSGAAKDLDEAGKKLMNLMLGKTLEGNEFIAGGARAEKGSGEKKAFDEQVNSVKGFFDAITAQADSSASSVERIRALNESIILQEVTLLELEKKQAEARQDNLDKLKQIQSALAGMDTSIQISQMEADVVRGNMTQEELQQEKDRVKDDQNIEKFENKLRKTQDAEIQARLNVKRDELVTGGMADNSGELKKALLAEEKTMREEADAKFAQSVQQFKEATQDLTFAKQIERAAKNAAKELAKAQQDRKKKQDEALGMADELVAKEKEGATTAQAGVSSLAAIGGGGGVGRGQDLAKQGVDIAANQLEELKAIASKLNVNWDDLKPEEQDRLKAFKKQLDKDVAEGDVQQGVANAAMKNLILQQEAQKDDKEVARLGKIADLANLGQDEIKNAPKAEDLKGVQNLMGRLADPKQADAVDREQAALEFEERGMDEVAAMIRNLQIAMGDFDDPNMNRPEGREEETPQERFARLEKARKEGRPMKTDEELQAMDDRERVEQEVLDSFDSGMQASAKGKTQAGLDRMSAFNKGGMSALNLPKVVGGSGPDGEGLKEGLFDFNEGGQALLQKATDPMQADDGDAVVQKLDETNKLLRKIVETPAPKATGLTVEVTG